VNPEYVQELAGLHGVKIDAPAAERRAQEIELNLAKLDGVPAETLQSVPPAYLLPPRPPRKSAR
jgi:hypothetical protein